MLKPGKAGVYKIFTKPRPTGPKPQKPLKNPPTPQAGKNTWPTGQDKVEIPRKTKSQSI